MVLTWKPTPAKHDSCISDEPGVEYKSSRLYGIVGDWATICKKTSNPEFNRVPDKCVDKGIIGGEWGLWKVPNSSACKVTWDSSKYDSCKSGGIEVKSSQVKVPAGVSWEKACTQTVNPEFGRVPDHCENKGAGGEWGFWDIPNSKVCEPSWSKSFNDSCTITGKQVKSAQIIIPTGDNTPWETACEQTINPEFGTIPNYCKNLNIKGEWGFWDTDTPCTDPSFWQRLLQLSITTLLIIGVIIFAVIMFIVLIIWLIKRAL
jgi:hypothetical protein